MRVPPRHEHLQVPKEIRHVAQDESCYRCYALSSMEWVVYGRRRPVRGKWCLGSDDEVLGFGADLPGGILAKVNEFRERVGRPELISSPGLRFMEYGKKKDG